MYMVGSVSRYNTWHPVDLGNCDRETIDLLDQFVVKISACSCCGETVPDYLIEGDRCGACGSMNYYEKI